MVENDTSQKTIYMSLFILVVSILLSYSNTYQASWHLDDTNNILVNEPLHISDLQSTTLLKTILSNPKFPEKDILYRPLPNLSFALNWYWSENNVWGYHLVNIVIHCIASSFLFFSILRLFQTQSLSSEDKFVTYGTALLATLLWALNPVQTQAVTYIVQRMASMAGMFYIMAIYFYLRLRQTSSTRGWVFFSLGLLVCSLAALGSKENSIILPFSLLLIEFFFFQKNGTFFTLRNVLFCSAGLCLMSAIGVFLLMGEPLAILQVYDERPFTLTERLLTESRIIIYYLSQLFYPATFRLSLEHDIPLSTSLISPWTTILAIAAIASLLGLAIMQRKNYPLFAFAILFYFLNHTVESTIIPLELIFEHRNYIPSMFLFLPLAYYFVKFSFQFYEENTLRFYFLAASAVFLVSILGTGTYVRNMVWETEYSLWQDTISKAPNSARAAYILGNVYLDAGYYDEARQYFKRSELYYENAPLPQVTKNNAINGIGSTYLLSDRPRLAIPFFEQTLNFDPRHNLARFNLCLALLSLHNWTEAEKNVKILVSIDRGNIDYKYLHSIIQLKTQKTSSYKSEDLLRRNPVNPNLRLLIAIAYREIGEYSESLKYLYEYDKLLSKNISSKLALLEMYTLQNDIAGKDATIKYIVETFTKFEIDKGLEASSIMGMKIFSRKKMTDLISASGV